MPIRMQTRGFDSKAWLDEFFERHVDQVKIVRVEPWDGGEWRYVLERCAFDEGHANNATAAVLIRHRGIYAYVCQHQSCGGKDWKQFRALFETASQPPPTSSSAGRHRTASSADAPRSEWSAPDLFNADLAPLHVIVPDLIYEGLGILAGRPKFGKSFIIFDAGIAIAGGSEALQSIECEEGDVLYYALEDGARRLQSRLRSTLGTREPPPRLEIRTRLDKLNEGGIEEIEVWLEQHPEARLVAIDTWKRVQPAHDPKAEMYGTDYDSAVSLKQLADRHHVAIVLIHHTRKPFSGGSVYDFLDEVMGTSGVTAAADSVLVIQRQRGHDDAILHVTGRDVREVARDMTWDAETLRWKLGEDAEAAQTSRSRKTVLSEVNARAEWRTPTEVHADLEAPMGFEAVKKMLRRLWRDGLIESDGKGRYAKKGTPTATEAQAKGVTLTGARARDAKHVPVSPKANSDLSRAPTNVPEMSPTDVPVSPVQGHGDIAQGHLGDIPRPPTPLISISEQGVGGHGDTNGYARAHARELSADDDDVERL